MSNVLPMVPKTIRAQRIREKIDNVETRTKEEWKVAVLELAEEFYAARQDFPNDNDFHHWLVDTNLDAYGKDDRTGLIKMGQHISLTRIVLQETESTSYRLIWEKEVAPRVRSAANPALEILELPEAPEPPSEPQEKPKPENTEAEKIEPEEKTKKKYQIKIGNAEERELVEAYLTNSKTRRVLSELKAGGGHNEIWKLIVQSIREGLFGEPSSVALNKFDLRILLPWVTERDAKKYDLRHIANRFLVTDQIFPVVKKHKEALLSNPSQLATLMQQEQLAREQFKKQEQDEKLRQRRLSEKGGKLTVTYGEEIWPTNHNRWTYDQALGAAWYFSFLRDQLKVELTSQGKAQQIKLLFKWMAEYIDRDKIGWKYCVEKIADAYGRNPDGNWAVEPPPPNYGLEN